ncbi:MAG TPA: inorganic phosphate transporter [Verrucomicrobiota bacterium]|nr:inorganic phosphate transporter [Verrucomicrobiota bacterium]HRZ38863.1 inorganic phosphate transporter [Candidatus Paceibacterota bacterium]HRZ54619.1 inorganic phosphate transporter [Candidatus Paceibacterota bacterium]
MLMVFTIIAVALAFEFINGFHDTANAIATTVATKVLTPRQAVMMAAVFNLLGALVGTAVATTIGRGLVDANYVTPTVILCALGSAIIWNLLTWWWGLPSSSSHALIGGLCGAALAAAGHWSVVHWSVLDPATGHMVGLWPKVIRPMVLSPLFGVLLGFLFMGVLLGWVHRWRPAVIRNSFRRIHLLSAAWMSFSHGTNDAQKTMGIIALTLFTATTTPGVFDGLPGWLNFLRAPEFHVYVWIKVVCALTMAAGTAAGGWRIIATMGRKMVRLQPIHGFAAQIAAASIIQVASHWGMPLSTTHVISSSIMGVGATKRLNAVRWTVVERMVWAWIMTLPVTALLGYALAWLASWLWP